MEVLKQLDPMFESGTIKPAFKVAHIILALLIFEENPKGIGRYRLREKLNISSGTARSLLKRLKENVKFIDVPSDGKEISQKVKRRGHILTEKGKEFLIKFKKKIPFIVPGNKEILKDLIINPENTEPYVCLIKNAAHNIKSGVEQRDSAISVGGLGATCLIYDGTDIVFPSDYPRSPGIKSIKVADSIAEYLTSLALKHGVNLEKNDVLLIGLGENPELARLVSLNAALTLI